MILYGTPSFPLYSQRSFPLSKLNAIEEQLRPFSEKQESPQSVDHVHVGEDVFELLEDLQEAILNHLVRSRPKT